MFEKTSKMITHKLKENNIITSEQYEICQFGVQQGLTIILNIITTIIIGIVLGMLWQAVVFMVLYIPLRSNAGGYHARNAVLCYVYSVLLMITVLLAIKHLLIPRFICIIAFLISCMIILFLAPVEDYNKPLDSIEQKVYKKRTMIIIAIESLLFLIGILFNRTGLAICFVWVYITMAVILCIGKYKNNMTISINVH